MRDLPKDEFKTDLLRSFLSKYNLTAMDLVRLCDISVTSGYRIMRSDTFSDLNVFYKVWKGLNAAGYKVSFKDITGIE